MTKQEAIEDLKEALEYNESRRGFDDYIPISEEVAELALEALEKEPCEDKKNRNARMIYDFLKIKIGSKIVDNPFEFEDWYNRMIWHVQEWYKLQKNYKGGEIAEPKRGKWIFKTVFPNDKSEFPRGYIVCSICGSHHRNSTPCNYCPNCGARMESDEE